MEEQKTDPENHGMARDVVRKRVNRVVKNGAGMEHVISQKSPEHLQDACNAYKED